MKWQVFTRGTIVPYLLSFPMEVSAKRSGDFFGHTITEIIYAHENGKMWWTWENSEMAALGKEFLQDYGNDKKRDVRLKKIERISRDSINALEKVLEDSFEGKDESEILRVYEHVEVITNDAHALLSVDIDVADVYLENHIREIIAQQLSGCPKEDIDRVQTTLLVPLYDSFVAQEEIDVLRLALKAHVEENDLKAHTEKYWWTTMGWESTDVSTPEHYASRISEHRKAPKETRKQLEHLLGLQEKHTEDRKRIIQEYGLGAEVEKWLHCLDAYALFHDLRKEMQVKYVHTLHLLAQEVMRLKNLTEEEINWMTHIEIKDLLTGKEIDIDEVRRRGKEPFLMILRDAKWTIEVGDRAREIRIKELEEEDIGDVTEVSGISASKGIVQGTVRICYGYKQALEKVQAGDVLVCGMTTPDYVPAMKNAGAIVTNEGGVTSHAAIISRELKKPCIIGTKIATEVFKDGDMVEVNADNGTVRIIE